MGFIRVFCLFMSKIFYLAKYELVSSFSFTHCLVNKINNCSIFFKGHWFQLLLIFRQHWNMTSRFATRANEDPNKHVHDESISHYSFDYTAHIIVCLGHLYFVNFILPWYLLHFHVYQHLQGLIPSMTCSLSITMHLYDNTKYTGHRIYVWLHNTIIQSVWSM